MATRLAEIRSKIKKKFKNQKAAAICKTCTTDDFIPLVILKTPISSKNIMVMLPTKNCKIKSCEIKFKLSNKFSAPLRDYSIPVITVNKNSPNKITLEILPGSSIATDNDGILEFSSSNSAVEISPKSANVNYGSNNTIELTIKNKKLARGTSFEILIQATDNNDGPQKTSNISVISGKLILNVIARDTFNSTEHKAAQDEITLVQAAKTKQSYCLRASERYLSKFVPYYKGFYTSTNKFSMDGKEANARGRKFYTDGHSEKEKILYFKINPRFRREILLHMNSEKAEFKKANKTNKHYNRDLGRLIKLTADLYGDRKFTDFVDFYPGDDTILDYFKKSIKDKYGFHVYYMSVSNAYHAQTLIIDNTSCCNPTYKIYEQSGSSHWSPGGPLDTLREAIRAQVSWTSFRFYTGKMEENLLKRADPLVTLPIMRLFKLLR